MQRCRRSVMARALLGCAGLARVAQAAAQEDGWADAPALKEEERDGAWADLPAAEDEEVDDWAGAPAAEDEEDEDASEVSPAAAAQGHRLSLGLGLGAPLGLIGASWTVASDERLRVESGIGLGPTGAQLALMPTLAFGSEGDAYVVGLGLSWSDDCCAWIHVEPFGYESTSEGGFSFHVAAGATVPTGRWSTTVMWSRSGVDPWDVIPYVRLGLGWWIANERRPSVSKRSTAERPWHRVSLQVGYLDGVDLTLAYAFAPLPWLRFEADVASQHTLLRVGLLSSVVVGRGNTHLTAGLGAFRGWTEVCFGTLDQGGACSGPSGTVLSGMAPRYSLRVDTLGFEHLFDSGYTLFGSAGFTNPLERLAVVAGPGFWAETQLHVRVGTGW